MRRQKQNAPERMLRKASLRQTDGRLAILKVLSEAQIALTPEQIASRLGERNVNKVTVYRALERFVKAGLVHKAYTHKRTWHFELAGNCGKRKCHPHFTCKKCGATRCLIEVSFPVVRGLSKGFVVHRQQVQLEGLCPSCA